MKKNKHLGNLLIRVSISFTMLIYGIDKLLHGMEYIDELLSKHGLPSWISNGVLVGEVLAPLMIIVGYRTRLAGLIFAFNCLAAFILAQTQNLFKLNEKGGWALELLAIYLIAGLAFYFMGGGKYAVSRLNKWD
ncbi:DoxX family protein [Muricauda sp. ANG21]|uniref:DoxX family protein n=1 Tax=Allomuricauda sp. ANG21 TaxID=3042468 RepID=UPI003456CB5A